MDHNHAYRRYTEIDRCFNSKKKYWTKKEILQALRNKDFDISDSTFDKDIWNMRYETSLPFQNAPIKYISKSQPWHYSEPFSISIPVDDYEMHALDVAARTLNQFKDIEFFTHFSGAVDKVIRFVKQVKATRDENSQPFILFEKAPYLRGYEYLDSILNAIENKCCMQLNYQRFGHDDSYSVELHPYFVKEFHNRWYIVGYLEERKDLRTFALDRIQDISLCATTYIPNTSVDPEDYFKDFIGINFMDRKIEIVKLSFTIEQGYYIKTQHLHRSQVDSEGGPDEVVIDLNLIVNHELKMQILSFGDQVKVLAPTSLAEEIAAISRRVVESYDSNPRKS
jgi:predicted DNA-binding transcriptional regulator YafY